MSFQDSRSGNKPPSSSSLPLQQPSIPSTFTSGFILPPPPPSNYPPSSYIPVASTSSLVPPTAPRQFPLSHHKPIPTLKAKIPPSKQLPKPPSGPSPSSRFPTASIASDPEGDRHVNIVAWASKVQDVLTMIPAQNFLWWDAGKKQKVLQKFNKLLALRAFDPAPYIGVPYLVAEFLRREDGPLPAVLAQSWATNLGMDSKMIQKVFGALSAAGLVGGGGDVTRRNPNDPRPDRLKAYGVGVEGLVQTVVERAGVEGGKQDLVAGEGGEDPATKRARTTSTNDADKRNDPLPPTGPRPKLLTTTSSSSAKGLEPQESSLTQLAASNLAWALKIVPLLPSSIPSSPLDSTRQAAFLSLYAFRFLPPPIPQAPYLLSLFKIHSGALTWKIAEKVGKEAIPEELDSRKVVAIFKAWKKAGLGNSTELSTPRQDSPSTTTTHPAPSSSSLKPSTTNPLLSTNGRDGSPSTSSRRSSSSDPSSTSEARTEEIRLRLEKLKSLVPPISFGSSSPGPQPLAFPPPSSQATPRLSPTPYPQSSAQPLHPSQSSASSSSRQAKVEDLGPPIPFSTSISLSNAGRTTSEASQADSLGRRIESKSVVGKEDGRSAEAAWSVDDDEEPTTTTTSQTLLPLPSSTSASSSSSSLKRKRSDLPEGWVIVRSKTWDGAGYYFCKERRETRWTHPDPDA
ncbi:hypothetical protein BDY24DRAFT_399040 [Mrakia frigida]|uniref:uncharacterized protein n=1 Tax=Mrakia frigida TaxID=29902 RepID=UPI003FCBFA20